MNFPPPLTSDEETLLFAKMQAGDASARERIILSVMPFVLKQAGSSRAYYCEYEELVSEGALKVCKAIDSFDPSRGVRFITYLGMVLHNQHTRLGVKAATEEALKVDDPEELLVAEHYAEVYEEKFSDQADVEDLLEKLDYQAQYILVRRFGLFGNNQEHVYETADKLGVSRSTINELTDMAMAKLRGIVQNDLS